jgi:putative PIN family toxin of toxin-antitoxin system
MRLVLDTCVMVSAIRSDRGASRQLLEMVLRGNLHPLVSVPLFMEYEATMMRKEHIEKSGGSPDDIRRILDAIAIYVDEVVIWFLTRPATKDAGDDMVLEAAVNGRADAIVTENIADFGDGALRYGIRVLKPGEALQQVRGMTR